MKFIQFAVDHSKANPGNCRVEFDQDLIFFEGEMISRYDAALALLPAAVPPATESPATEEAE